MTYCFMNLGSGELILIALVVLLLFGGRKIPELMRGLGKGVRSFKEGLREAQSEIDNGEPASGESGEKQGRS